MDADDPAPRPGNPDAPGADPVAAFPVPPAPGVLEFGEQAYLEAFPDVAEAVGRGDLVSALDHYKEHGRREGRLSQAAFLAALSCGAGETEAHDAIGLHVEAVILSDSGNAFLVGWLDDRANPLVSLSVVPGRQEGWNTRAFGRSRRGDVEAALGVPPGHAFGFWSVFRFGWFEAGAGPALVRARLADGRFVQAEAPPRVVSDAELREIALGHFATLEYLGNRDIEAFAVLEGGTGQALVAMNRAISAAITRNAHVERYGPQRAGFSASVVVCLFGRHEYFFLQNALFAGGIGVDGCEFIYVSNSPELTEVLHKEAQIAARIYGLSLVLVTLPGNAGFSAANNAAAKVARSDRVVFLNPDVFPRDGRWAAMHRTLLDALPPEQTALFGAPLYYDDGSLMHGGMFFEIDRGLSVKPDAIGAQGMVRVEHYGKGAPDWSDRYTRARPVPAVTGALVSADRRWFEALGGFTEDYLFGHYEDADLCLKSLSRGVPAWMQDVRFWHLEGKGSVRRPPHEGGSLVNRWLFTRTWGDVIANGLAGRAPSHPLLNGAAPTPLPQALAQATLEQAALAHAEMARATSAHTTAPAPADPASMREPPAPPRAKRARQQTTQ